MVQDQQRSRTGEVAYTAYKYLGAVDIQIFCGRSAGKRIAGRRGWRRVARRMMFKYCALGQRRRFRFARDDFGPGRLRIESVASVEAIADAVAEADWNFEIAQHIERAVTEGSGVANAVVVSRFKQLHNAPMQEIQIRYVGVGARLRGLSIPRPED